MQRIAARFSFTSIRHDCTAMVRLLSMPSLLSFSRSPIFPSLGREQGSRSSSTQARPYSNVSLDASLPFWLPLPSEWDTRHVFRMTSTVSPRLPHCPPDISRFAARQHRYVPVKSFFPGLIARRLSAAGHRRNGVSSISASDGSLCRPNLRHANFISALRTPILCLL